MPPLLALFCEEDSHHPFLANRCLAKLRFCSAPPHYPILPISLNSLDLAGFEIAESSWLTYSTKTVACAVDASAGDATELKWEFDEELGRYYVSFPDDQ